MKVFKLNKIVLVEVLKEVSKICKGEVLQSIYLFIVQAESVSSNFRHGGFATASRARHNNHLVMSKSVFKLRERSQKCLDMKQRNHSKVGLYASRQFEYLTGLLNFELSFISDSEPGVGADC